MSFCFRIARGVTLIVVLALVTAVAVPEASEPGPTVTTLRGMRSALRTLTATPRDLADAETADFRTLLAQTRTHLGALLETYAAREADEAGLAEFSRLHLRLAQLAAKSTIASADLETLRSVENGLRSKREAAARARE